MLEKSQAEIIRRGVENSQLSKIFSLEKSHAGEGTHKLMRELMLLPLSSPTADTVFLPPSWFHPDLPF